MPFEHPVICRRNTFTYNRDSLYFSLPLDVASDLRGKMATTSGGHSNMSSQGPKYIAFYKVNFYAGGSLSYPYPLYIAEL